MQTTDLCQVFRQGRRSAKMSQTQVAQTISVSRGYIALVETGKTVPTMDKAKAILSIYGTELSDRELTKLLVQARCPRTRDPQKEKLLNAMDRGDKDACYRILADYFSGKKN